MITRPLLNPEIDGKKKCSKCQETKAIEDFADRGVKKGHSRFSHCRPCRSEAARATKYFKRYGITWEQYKAMLITQDNRCAVCGRKADRGRSPWSNQPTLVMDHNHKTGKARALLCNRCNWALGVLENRKLVKKLKKYLAGFEEM